MAVCNNCGAEISDTAKFCNKCGQPVTPSFNNSYSTNQSSYNSYGNSQQNYNPNFVQDDGNMLSQMNGGNVDFHIRRYFMGFGDIIWIGLILWIVNALLGVTGAPFFRVFMIIGIIVFVAGIIGQIYYILAGIGANNVDAATQQAYNMLKERAYTKLNVDKEEVNEISPIALLGYGVAPNLSFLHVHSRMNRISKYFTKDPVEAYRANGGVLRSMLIQVSVYAFSQKQLLLYEGNIDLSTGRIYDERTTEVFYQDITTIDKEEQLKKVKAGIFKKDYRIFHTLSFDINGVTRGTSFDTTRYSEDDIAQSLNGMQSYIRDKKGEV